MKYISGINKRDEPISRYDWRETTKEDETLDKVVFNESDYLVDTIDTILSKAPREEKFDSKNLGHIMLLLIGILSSARIARFKEIEFAIEQFGTIKYIRKDIKQWLSLLDSLKLIKIAGYGNGTYYTSTYPESTVIWGYKNSSAIKDSSRWMVKLIKYYQKKTS